jgi:hypothetical protein
MSSPRDAEMNALKVRIAKLEVEYDAPLTAPEDKRLLLAAMTAICKDITALRASGSFLNSRPL